MAGFDEFKDALNDLKDTLTRDFGTANGGPIETVGVNAGTTDVDKDEYGIAIILEREPTDSEKQSLPDSYKGFEIEYMVR